MLCRYFPGLYYIFLSDLSGFNRFSNVTKINYLNVEVKLISYHHLSSEMALMEEIFCTLGLINLFFLKRFLFDPIRFPSRPSSCCKV